MYKKKKNTWKGKKVMIWLAWSKSNPYLLPEIFNINPLGEKGLKNSYAWYKEINAP